MHLFPLYIIWDMPVPTLLRCEIYRNDAGVKVPADSAAAVVKFTISIPRERAPMRRRSTVVV